jgi:hypothetical protein
MLEEATTVERTLGKARDFDLREDGSWIGVFERPDGLHIADSHGRSFPLGRAVRFPIVRALGFDRVVVVDARPVPTTAGGFVFSLAGQTLCSFAVGDGVQDVLVLEDAIVAKRPSRSVEPFSPSVRASSPMVNSPWPPRMRAVSTPMRWL